MSDYLVNIDTTYLDSSGRKIIYSDTVLDIFYYDSSSESWLKDYSTTTDIVDPYFETLVSGTSGVWKDTSSNTISGTYIATTNFSVLNESFDMLKVLQLHQVLTLRFLLYLLDGLYLMIILLILIVELY